MKAPVAAIDTARFAALQDGFYAIAMTLLVLELRVPALPTQLSSAQLWLALVALWPKLLTWLLSFWVLAVFWLGDARGLAAVRVVDGFLVRVGLWRLALVSLLPFSSALIGLHGDLTPAAAVYAAHLLLMAGTQVIRHAYLRRHREALTDLPPQGLAAAGVQAWVTLASAAAALGLAFLVPGYNMFALLPVPVLHWVQRYATRVAPDAAPDSGQTPRE